MLYSFQKAGIYLIQGFGQLNNPYTALEAGLSISIAGCLLCIFFPHNLYLLDIGATLIGLGLSNYSSLFKTIKDRRKAPSTWNYGKSLLYGYLILLGIIGFVDLFMKRFHGRV